MKYYDRQGNPISDAEGMKIWDNNADDRRVGDTEVGEFWVSTVYLGFDHQYGDGPPLIFETMVFRKVGDQVDFSELYCDRYSTEEEAKAGHDEVVAALENGTLTMYDSDD